MSPKRYVVGFLFDERKQSVVLLRKRRPEWQYDLLNGPGGRIELHETPLDAMNREAKEEIGVTPRSWTLFARVLFEDTGIEVLFFRAFDQVAFDEARTNTDEKVMKVLLDELSGLRVVNNVRWLVPLALDAEVSNAVEVLCTSGKNPVRGSGS